MSATTVTPFADTVDEVTPEAVAGAKRRALEVARCWCSAVLADGQITCGASDCERCEAMDRKGLIP